jgi:tetratricopeptide (TPR) repeat protein
MSRRPKKTAPPEPRGSQRLAVLAICGLLLLAVWIVFAQTTDYGFVNYDDEMNLYGNPAIRQGLSLDGIRWASTTAHGSQWAPITWMSYLADYQIYGLKPQGCHRTNVLLHSATTILLFLALWRMIGRLWPCAFVAAVFAVHPLHVESVAWLAERKGLLSGLFFALTLGAYAEYVRRRSLPGCCLAYLGVLVFFALGLMSKPVLVTVPFVLLLLDYWPLGRMRALRWGGSCTATPGTAVQLPSQRGRVDKPLAVSQGLPLGRLIVEKLPLLLLSIASSMIATRAQGTAVISLEKIPLPARIGNALVSYVDYLGETFWPTNLAVFYPHPLDTLPLWKPVVALLILLGITAAVLLRWRRNPYLPVGWFWYLGMLVPAIGLVQIGVHAMADRYMYLPQIGLCMALTWGALQVSRPWPHRVLACGTLASLLVVALAACAIQQTTYWRDSEALWTHAIACTPPNSLAHSNLGGALAERGEFDKAIEQYEAALAIDPKDGKSYSLLGDALLHLHQTDAAIEQYEKALRIQPDSAETQSNYGAALTRKKRFEEAVAHCEKALQIEPNYVEAHSNLGNALAHLGRLDEAIDQYEAALRIAPDRAEIRYNLNLVLSARARQKAK